MAHTQWAGSGWVTFGKKQPALTCAPDCSGCQVKPPRGDPPPAEPPPAEEPPKAAGEE